MAASLRAAQGSNNAGGGTTITMTLPTGTANGDVLVGAIDTRNAGLSTITPNWTTRTSNLLSFGNGGLFANGIHVIYDQAGGISTSTDTVTWTARTSSFGTTGIDRIAYGAGSAGAQWVACGNNKIATATDPTGTWTQGTSAFDTSAARVGYGNGNWVMAGNNAGAVRLVTATDPTGTWTVRTTPMTGTTAHAVCYSPGLNLWVATDVNGGIVTATDPTSTWTSRTNPNGTSSIDDLIWTGSYFLGASFPPVYSYDGITWAQTGAPPGASASGRIAMGDGGVVISLDGSRTMCVSTDGGFTWIAQGTGPRAIQSPAATQPVAAYFAGAPGTNSVAGTWVIIGNNGSTGPFLATWATAYPMSWLQLGSVTNGTTLLTGLIYKIAWTEPTSYSFTLSTTAKASGTLAAVQSASFQIATTQFALQTNTTSSATDNTPATGTYTAGDGIGLIFGGTATGTTVSTNPTGYSLPTNGQSASTGGSTGSRTTSAVFNSTAALNNSTSIATNSFTFGAAAVNDGATVFIRGTWVEPIRSAGVFGPTGPATVNQAVGRASM